MEIAGLNYFYRYMNAHYGDGWMLVGGAAAWEHILNATSIQHLVKGAYSNIFPDDIDVLTVATPKENSIKVLCSDKTFDVEFVDAQSIETAEGLCKTAKVVRGARVASIDDIINKYTIATSKKAEVRQTRVALLQMIKRDQAVTPDMEKQIFIEKTESLRKNPLAANPFSGGLSKLKPVQIVRK